MPFPDFYIVGAPRCGTTFLYAALRAHPGIFLPRRKEPRFFCPDLDSGSDADAELFTRDVDEYLALYADASPDQRVGDASPQYLFSEVAPSAIRAASPDARVIAMLRDPIEQMLSHHAMRLRVGSEDLPFAEAIAAEADRAEGRRLPRLARNVKSLQYRAVATYGPQLERYRGTFPPERIHVIVFDDLKVDATAVMSDVLRFLDVDEAHTVPTSAVNANRADRSRAVGAVLRSTRLRHAARLVVPDRVRAPIARSVERARRANRVRMETPLDRGLRDNLRAELGPDVDRVSEMLGRDLRTLWWGSGDGPVAGDSSPGRLAAGTGVTS